MLKNKSEIHKTIGIIGGMGPQASSYLYDLLIKKAIRDFGVEKNEDFPDIILFSVSVPDFISNKENQKRALEILKQKVHDANKLNISCLSIACNTAHLLLPQLQSETTIPFISMIDVVVEQIRKDKILKVGLLGSPATMQSGLYQDKFAKQDIETILPSKSQIPLIERAIRNVIGGKKEKKDEDNLKKIAFSLVDKGAEGIVLGCTELPLAFPKVFDVPIFNSVEILADAFLDHFYKR